LQPACISYVLLGLTFWVLWKPHAGDEETVGRGKSRRRYLALAGVFALWANVDEWFLLGPLLAALFWAGERLGGRRVTPGWVVPVGLAACLLNPHTFHVFTLPAELSPVTWTSGLRQDARFQGVFASPWQAEYLHAAVALNAAALAYFALTLLGLASFLLHRPALRDWRLAVWLPFALLAAWQARTIPFFAVVAAPVLTLNVQDAFAVRGNRGVNATAWSAVFRTAGRLTLVFGLLALILLTWLGRLAGYDREERPVAWGVQADPSLRQAAETLDRWRRQGLLSADERVFAVAPEVAHYGAWFGPGEMHFLDHRFALYPRAAAQYEAVCRALLPEAAPPASPPPGPGGHAADWRQVLREHRVAVVVFADRNPERLFPVLHRLAGDPEHWTLLHVAGQALVVGWNEARPRGAFGPLAFDADGLAFGPQGERARREAPPAPDEGPDHLPPRRDFWDRLARPPAPSSWESAAATVELHLFQDTEPSQRQQQLRSSMSGYAAGLTGLLADPSAVPQTAFQIASARGLLFPGDAGTRFLVREQLGPFFAALAERSPALPLLVVRAARRAVAANPEDAGAWLRLGEAYLLLRGVTREHSAEGLLPPLAQLRHVQIVTALEQALRLDPDLEAAHHELAYLYGQRLYLDLALEHQQEELRLTTRAGPRPGEGADEFAGRLEQLEKDTAKLVEMVREGRKKFAAGSPALQGDRVAQADLALRLGMGRLAVEEVLLSSPVDVLGAAGMRLELDLLLMQGRAEDVRSILSDQALRASRHGLGYYDLVAPRSAGGGALYALPYRWPAYEWLHVLETAAVGDYAHTRVDLRAIRTGLRAGHEGLRQQLWQLERNAHDPVPGLLSGPLPFLPAFAAQTLVRVQGQRVRLEAGGQAYRAQQADLYVLEGLLALEQGDPAAARGAFNDAQKVCDPPPGEAVPYASRPIAAGYLGQLGAGE
jgi:hypothetical protein